MARVLSGTVIEVNWLLKEKALFALLPTSRIVPTTNTRITARGLLVFVASWCQVSDETLLVSEIHDEAVNTDREENHCNHTNRNEYGVEHNSSDAVPITILRLLD